MPSASRPKSSSTTSTRADLSQRPFRLKGDNGEYTADALIIATGATAKYLGLRSEQKFMGRGVSACATCDGFFFKDRTSRSIGGGNTAVEEALYLSNIARKVYLVHRRDKLRAEKIMQDKLHAQDPGRQDRAGLAPRGRRSARQRCRRHRPAREVHAGRQRRARSPIHGLFVAIGHTPNTSLFEGQLAMNNGYIEIRSGLAGGATRDLRPRRVRRRRRRRPGLSPGHHVGRLRLHGRAGRREVPRQGRLMRARICRMTRRASSARCGHPRRAVGCAA